MIYLHYYETGEEFSEIYDGSGYTEPWTSLTVEGHKVDYNKTREYEITVTYVNRAGTGTTVETTATGQEGEPVRFNAAEEPDPWDSGHTFIGWATSEWPTSEQLSTPGFIKEPGDVVESDDDITLYAIYSIYFQTLIDENYVRFSTADPTGDLGIKVLANNYAKELVVDFMDVFNNEPDKYIRKDSATYGVVGASSGRPYNTFMFASTGMDQYWLTSDEWYDIYNNATLKHWPQTTQFYGMDWSNKESITINFGGTPASSWCCGADVFGPYMPRVLNVNLINGNQWGYMFQTFGQTSNGCGSEIINLSVNGGKATAVKRPSTPGQGFQAIFEGARNLKEVHGLETNGVTALAYMFDGCRAIEDIPASDFNAELKPGSMLQMFCNCWLLERIEPILHVSATTDCTLAFYSCTALTEFYLYGINAATNARASGGSFPQDTAYTWDLHYTLMTQTCADYMITNMVPFDPTSVQDYVYKGINFPSTVSLSTAQKSLLRANGWVPYINGVEQS